MKIKMLLLLFVLPVFSKATNVDSLKRVALEPVAYDYIFKAEKLIAAIKNTTDAALVKKNSDELETISDEFASTVKAFYPHGGGDISYGPTLALDGTLNYGLITSPYYGSTHSWESEARNISQHAEIIYRRAYKNVEKRDKWIADITEHLELIKDTLKK